MRAEGVDAIMPNRMFATAIIFFAYEQQITCNKYF
jgi:hypothetical protein